MRAASILLLVLAGCGARSEIRGSIDAGAGVSLCGIEADSGGGPCPDKLGGLTCCDGTEMNLENDPLDCGACGHRCAAGEMCFAGECTTPKCAPSCGPCQTCCAVNTAGPPQPPYCLDGPTCPVGCPVCT